MKKVTIGAIALTLICSLCLAVPAVASDYPVREVISLSVGESQQREFEVDAVSEFPGAMAVEGVVVVAAASTDAPAGALSIGLSASPDLDFGELMDYGIIVIGYSLDAGVIFAYETVTTPYTISESIAIDSSFGFVYVGALITVQTGVVSMPVAMKMTLSLAAQEAAAE